MAEYICRERFLKQLKEKPMLPFIEKSFLEGAISVFPAEDVRPVVHGKWIQDEHTYSGHWTYNFVCSSCGEIGGTWLREIRRNQMFPYCPYCGARMDGDGDD